MGEAKRRGTRANRIVQSIERKRLEDAARREEFQRKEAERKAKIAALPLEERKAAIFGSGGSRHRGLLLAAAMALAMPPMRSRK